jgi:DNA-binding NtrC family response regulator
MQRTILVVDDDDAVRRILRKLLESQSYRVVESGQPREACERFDADPAAIDLLVTDLKMPLMSGQQVAAHLRLARADMPVLFISGHSDQAYPRDLTGPRSRFIEKPFSSDVLLERVRELLAIVAADGGQL